MNIKQSNTLTNFYRPTEIPNKTNSNVDNADSTNSVFNTEFTKGVQIRLPTEEEKESIIGGGWTGSLTYELSYAENSTDENPIINAKIWEDNGYGEEINQTININDLDPRNITVIELEALNLHIYGKNPKNTLIDNFGFGSINAESSVLYTGEDPTANMGVNDRFDYIASLESELAYYEQYAKLPALKVTEEKISNTLDAFLKFEKNGNSSSHSNSSNVNKVNNIANNIRISNPVDEVVDDVATSMVDQFSKSSQLKKG